MRFLDAVEVTSDVALYGGERGEYSRSCGGFVRLIDACVDGITGVDLINSSDVEVSTYETLPFAVVAMLQVPVSCSRPDDEAWLGKALEASQEFALSQAMVVQPVAGTDSWVGAVGTQEVPLAAGADQDTLVTAVVTARNLWFTTVLSHDGKPLMHVAPAIAPALVRAGVLFISDPSGKGGVSSIWGDDVVIAAGYNISTPQVFFTGPIKVKLSPVDMSGLLVDPRSNLSVIMANQIAQIDVNPCSIVRVGDSLVAPFAASTKKERVPAHA